MQKTEFYCKKCKKYYINNKDKLICPSCKIEIPIIEGIPIFATENKWDVYYRRHRLKSYTDPVPSEPSVFYDSFIPSCNRLLDAGGGDGNVSALSVIKGKVKRAWVVDLAIYPLRKLQRRGLTNMISVSASILDLPFPDQFFDVVTNVFVIEHLTPEQGYQFLQEAKRVLKINGTFIIATDTPFYDSYTHIVEDFIRYGKLRRREPTHINLMTPQELRNMLSKAGWQIKQEQVNLIAGRHKWVRRLYNIFPTHIAENYFSTMYLFVCKKIQK